jgi:hypothetical protein
MITERMGTIKNRPQRLEGCPEQSRYVGPYHVGEAQVRELAFFFEGRLTDALVLGVKGDSGLNVAEWFLLEHLYREVCGFGVFDEFVEDFGSTQLGRLFKAWQERDWKQEQERKKKE